MELPAGWHVPVWDEIIVATYQRGQHYWPEMNEEMTKKGSHIETVIHLYVLVGTC